MRCNCSHLCRLSSSCVRLANSAHFSACRLKNFTDAMLGRLAFPGFCIAAFIILRCNENCIAPQQVSDWLGNDGARGHESGNVAQRLARPRTINMQQFPERSALPCRGANQTAREGGSSDFTDPCWHAPCDLEPAKAAQATKRNTPGCSGADEKRRPPL